MALTAYPFDLQDITEAQYGALIGATILSGIVGVPGSNHFKVTGDGSSMVLTASTVGGASTAIIRGHAAMATVNETATVSAAATSSRVDLVVLRMDYATNGVTLAIRAGTPGSSTPPSPVWGVSNQYEIPLATVAVGANVTTISNANITDVRRFVGLTIGAWPDNARRPADQPAFGYNQSSGKWEASYDGVTWLTLLSATAQLSDLGGVLSVAKGGTSGNTPALARNGLEIFVQSTAPAHAVNRVWIKTP